MSLQEQLERLEEGMQTLDSLCSDIASNVANMLAEEELFRPNQLLSKEVIFKKFYIEMAANIQGLKERLKKGALVILRTMSQSEESQVEEYVTHFLSLIDLIVTHRDQFIEELSQDKNIQEIAHIESLEKLYQAAKSLYDNSRFQESADAFNFLTILNPQNVAFWLGLANSEYQRKNYKEALVAYALVCQLDPDDYVCHIFSCRCYEALGDIKNAINSLELAQFVLKDQERELTLQIDDELKRLHQSAH